MSATVLLKELEAWVQAETAAKLRLRERIEAQIAAVEARSPRDLEAATHAVSRELAASAENDATRERILRGLARAHEISAGPLTLGAIVERAGVDGEVLDGLRRELRQTTSDLLRAVRRMSTLARLHREIVRESIATVAGSNALFDGGVLVNAQA